LFIAGTTSSIRRTKSMAGCELIALSIIAFLKIDVLFKEIFRVFSCPLKVIQKTLEVLINPTVSGEPYHF
jgi:hypothetical protein